MTLPSREVLISAPGGGLGHLVRACALALHLEELSVAARIVTNSPYAAGLAQLTACSIDAVRSSRWCAELPDYVEAVRPGLVVLDSFPWGLRGEWLGAAAATGPRFIYLARRLKVEEYLEELGCDWNSRAAQLERVIAVEPLDEAHRELLNESGGQIRELPGRIRFPAERFATPLPPELEKKLDSAEVGLLVHSGPEREVRELAGKARAWASATSGSQLVAVTPRDPGIDGASWFEYFPVARIFPRVARIFAGAGYNIISEAAGCGSKLCAIPFVRRYDDQAARLADEWNPPVDGAPAAADFIRAWL
jgi:hypothetical protein